MKEQSGCRNKQEKGWGRGGRAEKAGKMKGGRAGGWEMNAKNGWFQTFRLQEGTELIPNTPGPAASVDFSQSLRRFSYCVRLCDCTKSGARYSYNVGGC